jgi:UDP-glucuronate 4-epimerase
VGSILVTGGAGFIGSHLVGRLLKEDEKVIAIDNFDDYYDPKIKRSNIKEYLGNRNFELREVDLRDPQELRRVFQSDKIAQVIHLAARAGVRPSLKNPLLYEEVNIKGTLNLLEICKGYPVENFIFASSSSVYGTASTPFMEDENLNKPTSFYAATKQAGELICYTYHHLYSIPTTCLRLFTVYGPRQRPEMAIHKFTRLIDEGGEITIFGNGHSKRDYTYISDVIDGIMRVLHKKFDYEVFNLGSSQPIELRELVALIESGLGKKARIGYLPDQLGDLPITFADLTRSRKVLGYNPRIGIEEGIRRFIEWHRNKP